MYEKSHHRKEVLEHFNPDQFSISHSSEDESNSSSESGPGHHHKVNTIIEKIADLMVGLNKKLAYKAAILDGNHSREYTLSELDYASEGGYFVDNESSGDMNFRSMVVPDSNLKESVVQNSKRGSISKGALSHQRKPRRSIVQRQEVIQSEAIEPISNKSARASKISSSKVSSQGDDDKFDIIARLGGEFRVSLVIPDKFAKSLLNLSSNSISNSKLSKSSFQRSQDRGNISRSLTPFGLAGSNIDDEGRAGFAIPLEAIQNLKKMEKQYNKAQDSKLQNRHLSKAQITSYLNLSRNAIEDLKDANLEEDKVQEKLEIDEKEIEKIEKSLLGIQQDEEVSLETEQAFFHLAKKMSTLIPREEVIDKKEQKKIDSVLGAIPVLDIVRNSTRRASTVAIVPTEGPERQIKEAKKELEKSRAVEFLREFANHLGNTSLAHAEDIEQDVKRTLELLTREEEDITDDEREALASLVIKAMEVEFLVDKDNNDEKIKAKAVDNFGNALRIFNSLGQGGLLETLQNIQDKNTKQQFVTERIELIENDKITKRENPNLLEMSKMTKDKTRFYNLIKLAGKEILPPRLIQAGDQEGFQIYIPQSENKVGISRSILSERPMLADEEDPEVRKRFDNALKQFINIKRATFNSYERAQELFDEVSALDKKNGETIVELEKKIELFERLQNIMGKYSDSEKLAPLYAKQYQLANGIGAKSKYELQKEIKDTIAKLTEQKNAYIDSEPDMMRKEDIIQEFPELEDIMEDLREAAAALTQLFLNARFTQPSENKEIAGDMKVLRLNIVNTRNALNKLIPNSRSVSRIESGILDESAVSSLELEEQKEEIKDGLEGITHGLAGLKKIALKNQLSASRLEKDPDYHSSKSSSEIEVDEENLDKNFKSIYSKLIQKARDYEVAVEEVEKQEQEIKHLEEDRKHAEAEDDRQKLLDISNAKKKKEDNLKKARKSIFIAKEQMENLMTGIEGQTAALDDEEVDVIQEAFKSALQKSDAFQNEEGKEEDTEKRNELKSTLGQFLSTLKQAELDHSSRILEDEEGLFEKAEIPQNASRLEINHIEKKESVKTIINLGSKILLIKNILIKNLVALPKFTKHDEERAEVHKSRIESLVEEVKQGDGLRIQLLSKLKSFCRKMTAFKHSMEAMKKLNPSQADNLGYHIEAILEVVDKGYSLKIDACLAEVRICSETLKKQSKASEIDLYADPKTNLEAIESGLHPISKEEGEMISRTLHSLNTSVMSAAHNIQEAIFQKSTDIHVVVGELDPNIIVDKKNLSMIDHGVLDLANKVSEKGVTFASMMPFIINQIRAIEGAFQIFKTSEKIVSSKDRNKLGENTTYLTYIKHKMLNLDEIFKEGLLRINQNCINLIKNSTGMFSMKFTEEDLKKLDIPPFKRETMTNVFPIDFEMLKRKISIESKVSFKTDTATESSDRKNQILEFANNGVGFLEAFIGGTIDKTIEEKERELHLNGMEYKKVEILAEVEGLESNVNQLKSDVFLGNILLNRSGVGASRLGRSQEHFSRFIDEGEDIQEAFEVVEDQIISPAEEEESLYTDQEDSFYLPQKQEFMGTTISTLKRIVHVTRILKSKKSELKLAEDSLDSESAYYEDFFMPVLLPDDLKSKNSENIQTFKKQRRTLTPEERDEKKLRALEEKENEEIENDYSPEEIVKETILVPSNTWVNGVQLLVKKNAIIPIVADLDISRVKGEIGKLFINLNSGKDQDESKFVEEIREAKRFEVDFREKNSRYVVGTDMSSGRSMAIIRLGEKGVYNPILMQLRDSECKKIEFYVQQKVQINGEQVMQIKKINKQDPSMSQNSKAANNCLTKAELSIIIKGVEPTTMLLYYEEIGLEIEGLRVVKQCKMEDLTAGDIQFEHMKKLFQEMDAIVEIKEQKRSKIVKLEPQADGKQIYALTEAEKDTRSLNPISQFLRSLSPNPSTGKRSMNVSRSLMQNKSAFLFKTEEDLIDSNIEVLLKSQLKRIMRDDKDPTLDKQQLEALEIMKEEDKRRRSVLFKSVLSKANDVADILNEFQKVAGEAQNDESILEELKERYQEVQEEVRRRGIEFEDFAFPSNSSSMVNNSRRTKENYANLSWKKLSDIYEKPQLLVDFKPETLFAGGSNPPTLISILSCLCQWPKRIKKLFAQDKVSGDSMYMIQVNSSGSWTQVFIDDSIPLAVNGDPFVLCPTKHAEGRKILDGDRHANRASGLVANIDIWPQLITKALAKNCLNYERMIKQSHSQLMSTLTGMPTKVCNIDRSTISLLRGAFESQFPVLVEASDDFIDIAIDKGSVRGNEVRKDQLKYWILYHVINFTEEDSWIEIGHPFCSNPSPKVWGTGEDLIINEDWRRNRRYKRHMSNGTFWLRFPSFQQFFSSVLVCRYQETLKANSLSFVARDTTIQGYNLLITKPTKIIIDVIEIGSESKQLDRLPPQVRLFIAQEREIGSSGASQHLILKASSNRDKLTAMSEISLTPGNYSVFVDVVDRVPSRQKKYTLIVHSTDDSIKLELIWQPLLKKIMVGMLANLAIEKGAVEKLRDDKSISRYIFSSKKLGMCVFAYVNRSSNYFNIVDSLEISGEYVATRSVDNGISRIVLPPNSKKSMIFKFGSHTFCVKILESSIGLRA